MATLEQYCQQFKDVRPNRARGNTSPHKICMLFAVIDLIQDGLITDSRIYFNDTLKNRFALYFEQLKTPRDKLNAAFPFYYLRSSAFWHHYIKPDAQTQYDAIKTPSETSLANTVEYAFIDVELFELLQNPTTANKLKAAAAVNLDTHEAGFKIWTKAIGHSEAKVDEYVLALKEKVADLMIFDGLEQPNIFAVNDYFDVARMINKLRGLSDASNATYGDPATGHVATCIKALELYRAYLDQLSDIEAQLDIDHIQHDDSIAETTKAVLVQARRGQGKFRERLIKQWGGCAITGYKNISLLMASHIKPWSTSDNAERLDPYNGLLLTPNLDKAFDLHFISFNAKGRILISEALGDYYALGINKDMQVPLKEQHLPFIEQHRDVYFEKLG
ncbi:HNH endonuclease [Pseudidiomarina donghaiensis]|uniref:HNH endonuclease n=1 Tax=Pseudidiomarina donghaiensis TaxID=519452 RepID=A0A432XI82_9GAMM|nr:HNH endonuclease [Pseudidiomarina donghaiensis]RUO48443.1 HNH endonuclease [Pseudidiomarina donghaiensis]SFV24130.1 HNH endonuclease [Pseudidiomarina donghaiensis]